jgi:hypothetical protein
VSTWRLNVFAHIFFISVSANHRNLARLGGNAKDSRDFCDEVGDSPDRSLPAQAADFIWPLREELSLKTRQSRKNLLHRERFVQHLDQALSVSAVAATSKNGVAISLNSTNIIYAASTATNSDQFTYTVNDGSLTATGTNFVNVSTNGVLVVY